MPPSIKKATYEQINSECEKYFNDIAKVIDGQGDRVGYPAMIATLYLIKQQLDQNAFDLWGREGVEEIMNIVRWYLVARENPALRTSVS